MKETLIELALNWINQGQKIAICTVLDTWGSSPRPVGSQLIVSDSEMFQGSVSGGCIESAIITEAQFAIGSNTPQQLSFGIDNKQAWDFGLACGGAIEIYVDPVKKWQDTFVNLAGNIKKQIACCLITQIATGEKKLVPLDTVGNAHDFPAVLRKALSLRQNRVVGMGPDRFFLQFYLPPRQIIIGGAGHISQPLVKMAQVLGYQCTIVDPRKLFATKKRFPKTEIIVEHPKKALQKICLHSNSAMVALSHIPQFDDPFLIQALHSNVNYIGALGSKKNHAARIERLQKTGIPLHELNRIHGPVGLDIGSRTPPEIALSILAQITHKNREQTDKDTNEEPMQQLLKHAV